MVAEHKETLPEIWKIAALMELSPPLLPDLQDMVDQNVGGVFETTTSTSSGSWRGPRTQSANSMEPVPMDVGWVHKKEQGVEQEDVGAAGT